MNELNDRTAADVDLFVPESERPGADRGFAIQSSLNGQYASVSVQ
jgi:hypothetical protein